MNTTTTTPEGAGEFPPLPKPIAQIGKFLDDSTDVFDGSHMHAFAEATVALRAHAAPAPASEAEGWRIDTSAGRPILMYKDCSVIESEQASYVLGLIAFDQAAPKAPPADPAQQATKGEAS